jgi:hypothetical protein
MSSTRPFRLADTDSGALFAVPHDGDDDLAAPITKRLSTSTESPPPRSEAGGAGGDGGVAPRITDRFTPIGGSALRRIMLSGGESSEAIRTRRDELYRNAFPRIEPRYAVKCDACDSEFDTDHDECPACGSTDLSKPDPAEKRRAKRLFESVNAAGQSLRDIAKRAEEDQWTAGVSTLILTHDYYQATSGDLYDEGEIYREEPTGLHRADPFALRPVIDEDGQPGGVFYACPIHREIDEESGACECGAEKREVHFVEEQGRDDRIPYFRQEVVTWAYPQPRLHGLDGVAPAVHVWLKQAILQMMDRYAGAFYDPEADRLPNQFMILHTSNPDQWEDEMAKARSDEDQYRSPMFTNEYSPQDTAQPEVQVIDAMPDELLGQSEETKKTFKKDIRQAFGISDAHDSELDDAGGLNNEGLQLEVVDRSLASQMNDYREGWLDTLMKRLGFEGWRIGFLPDTGMDAGALRDNLKTAAFVKQAGGDARITDGRLKVDDFEVELDDSDDPPSLQGAADLPGVGSAIPEGGGGPGGDAGGGFGAAALQAEVSALETIDQRLRTGGSITAVDMKGAPVYDERDDIPANVQNRIGNAIDKHDFSGVSTMSTGNVEAVFKQSMTQPQGWSINSIARNLRKKAEGMDMDTARTIARDQSARIVNKAREDAVAELSRELDDEVLHYWDGPQDESTTEMCEWLKKKTNPAYDGDPVPMEELKRLQKEAVRKFSDEDPYSEHITDHHLHVNERHTHRSILRSALDD